MRRAASLTASALALALVLPAAVAAYEQPRNTISLGVQVQYGGLGGGTQTIPADNPANGAWASLFRFGEGLAFRIRYSTARDRAIGISFEDQRFRRRKGLGSGYPDQLQLNHLLGEYFMYFRRPRKLTRYVVVGAGFHRPAIRSETKDEATGQKLEEVSFPGEGVTVMLGLGLERFVSRRTSLDLSLRVYGVNSRPTFSVMGELALGVHLYTK
jgi:hypothetical protein